MDQQSLQHGSSESEIAIQATMTRLMEPFRQLSVNPALKYSRSHLWFQPRNRGRWRSGLDAFATLVLGQVTEIIYPAFHGRQETGSHLLWINHVGGVLVIRSPVPVTVLQGNSQLRAHPALLLSDPMGTGWLLEGEFQLADDSLSLIPPSDLIAWIQQEIEWFSREIGERLKQRMIPKIGETLWDGGVHVTDICSAVGPVAHRDLLRRITNP